jgi:MFS family permease
MADRRVDLASRIGPFRHRPFAVYWAGGVLSNLGTWLQAVAGSIFVYQLTASPLAVGILNFAGFLPILLFSVVGGVISDRFDRRQVVIVTHFISGSLAALLAVVTFTGQVTAAHLIVVAFALNTSYAVAKPAITSILPGLVPRDEVQDAVALNTLQFVSGQIGGPLIAAVVMATLGAAWAFAVNSLTFIGPVLAMVYLQRRGLGANTATPANRRSGASGAGASFVREHRWVLALLAGVVATSAPLEMIRTLSPALAVEGLGQPESAAGIIVAAQSVGSAIALFVFVPLRRRGLSERTAAVGLLIQAVGLVLTTVAATLTTAAVAVGLVGFGFSLTFPVLTGVLQAEVPDDVRGRVMAFHQMSHLGNRPLAAIIVGAVATVVGAQPAVLVGLLLIPVGLLAADRAWRELRRHPPDGPVDTDAEALAAAGSAPGP